MVEDDFLVAQQIAGLLSEAGSEVVGPAGTLDEALGLALGAVIDAAVLDIKLAGHRVFDVAGVLALRRIPFLFVAGYGSENIPEAFQVVTVMTKPFDPDKLLRAVHRLIPE